MWRFCIYAFLLLYIKQISDFGCNGTIGRAREIIFFGTVVEVGQSKIISAFQKEITGFSPDFNASSSYNSVIKLIFNPFTVLFIGCPIRGFPSTFSFSLSFNKRPICGPRFTKNCTPLSLPKARWARKGISR